MSLVVIGMQKYPLKQLSMILVVNSTDLDSDKLILETVKKYSTSYEVKSKNLTPSTLDMIIEIKVDAESELVHEVLHIDGVTSASILSHNGEITV